MSDSDFHLARFDQKIRFSGSRNGAWREAHTDAPRVVDRLLRNSDHFIQRAALSRLGTANFPHQNLSRHASPLWRLSLWRRCHIIVGDDRFDFDAFQRRELLGHLHVHVIARVVTVQTGDARAAIGGLEGIEKGLRGWRGKNFADGNGITHVLADVPDKGRFVAGASACDNADLTLDGRLNIFQDARIIFYRYNKVLVTFHKTLEHVFD